MPKVYKKILGFILLLLFFSSHSYYLYYHHCSNKDVSYITFGTSNSKDGPCNHDLPKNCCETNSHSCTNSCCSIDEIASDLIIINVEKRISKQDEDFNPVFSPVAITIEYASPLLIYNVKNPLSSSSINIFIAALDILSSIRLIC